MPDLVKLKAIALFPGLLTKVPNGCKPRRRWHKGGLCSTQVRCRIDRLDGRYVAVPEFVPAEGHPVPRFRFQLHVMRTLEPPRAVALALQAARDSRVKDPEHRILAPIYNGPERLIFEFSRADVFHVPLQGPIQIRFAAIDSRTGEVGTEEVPFDRAYLKLAQRCQAELSGGETIFSVPTRPNRKIPSQGLLLTFSSDADAAPSAQAKARKVVPVDARSFAEMSEADSVLRVLAQDGEQLSATPSAGEGEPELPPHEN